MPYFKDPQNKVHFLSEDDVQRGGAAMLPTGSQQITDAQAAELLPKPSASDIIKAQIATLEATITPRRLREAVLGTDSGWLAGVDQQIAALRAQLS